MGKDWAGVITYILDGSEAKSQVASDVSNTFSLPLKALSISPQSEDVFLADMLPVEEWLRAFAQADFVVTDSFHGCVFSIIHRKTFIVIANGVRGIDRINSLLGYFGLQDRLVFSMEDYRQKRSALLAPIDFAPVAEKLAQAQESSLAFLKEALSL